MADWQRVGPLERLDLLLWMGNQAAAAGGPLMEQLKKLFAEHQRGTLEPQSDLEAPAPGYRGCIDTYFVGTLNEIGLI